MSAFLCVLRRLFTLSSFLLRFIGAISHELRTPTFVIAGLAEELQRPDLPDLLRLKMLRELQHAALMLKVEVEDALLMSTLFSGVKSQITVASMPMSIRECIMTSIDFSQSKIKEGVLLTCETADNVPPVINSDMTRLSQMLVSSSSSSRSSSSDHNTALFASLICQTMTSQTNLISNASKFTVEGHINVACSIVTLDKENKKCILRFSVSDTGIGISEANLKMLQKFCFFQQVRRCSSCVHYAVSK